MKSDYRILKWMPLAAAAAIVMTGTVLQFGALDLVTAQTTKAAPAPNGIELPAGYKDWRMIAVSHRTDNDSLRAILGNDIAVQAARAGNTNPWPDGAIMAKLVLRDRTDSNWEDATVPGEFVHAEFMIKDSNKFAQTGGWGFARWLGKDQTPYGDDAEFVQECFACHTPVENNDYVFTHPVVLP